MKRILDVAKKELCSSIREELKSLYKDITDTRLEPLADEVCETITDSNTELFDLYLYMDEFNKELEEETGRNYGDPGEVLMIAIFFMPVNAANAQRLSYFFTENGNDFFAFIWLMANYREFLPDEQFDELVEEGKGIFEPQILRFSLPEIYED